MAKFSKYDCPEGLFPRGLVEFFQHPGDNNNMDPKLFIGFIFSHYIIIFGSTLALFFTVSMILLIRSIGQSGAEDGVGFAAIDVNAIEGAMKRVLASQPVSIASTTRIAAPSAEAPPSEQSADHHAGPDPEMERLLAEREQTIESLKGEIEALKAAEASAGASAGAGAEVEALHVKVDELQARLAEYEIIEDDIADLSMYKEENRKLKDEVEGLKSQLASGGGASAAPAAPVAAAPVAESAPKATSFEQVLPDQLPDDILAELNKVSEPSPENASPAAASSEFDDSNIDANSLEKTSFAPQEMGFEKLDTFELDLNSEDVKSFLASSQAPPELDPEITVEQKGGHDACSQAEIDALMRHADRYISHSPAPTQAAAPAPVEPVTAVPAVSGATAATPDPAPAPVPVVDLSNDLDGMLFTESQTVPDATAGESPAESETEVEAKLEVVSESPLDGTPDPDKMLAETEGLGEAVLGDTSSDLDNGVDTDRLLAEMNELGGGDALSESEADKKSAS
jgi:hypothetical protein